MISELKKVWKECFHDEDSYIDFYYENRFSKVTTLVKRVDGIIASMLTLIPCAFVKNEISQPLYYVYAVATRNEYQKRGYAKELILYAQQLANKEGAKTFLVPASKSLFSYYEKLGYQTAAYQTIAGAETTKKMLESVEKLSAMEIADSIQISELTAKDFYELREKHFTTEGYIRWDQEALSYLLEEYRFCGGVAWLITSEQHKGAILYHYIKEEKKLYVKETTLELQVLAQVLLHIGNQLDVAQVELKLKNGQDLGGEVKEFAMLSQSFSENLGFVNLVKD